MFPRNGKNANKYAEKLKLKIFDKLKFFGKKSKDLKDTIDFILERSK